MVKLIVRVRREHRDSVDPNWIDTLKAIEGVGSVTGNKRLVQIEIDPKISDQVKSVLGDKFLVEKVITYHTV